jgi:NAD-dependent dihydropyrimidine dehydrogenase PreA subunit
VYKRQDGLVIIDPVTAKGHPEIVATCPYEVIYWNEEAQVAQKCTGCAHLVDAGWTDTRCSQVCPAEAIKLVLGEDEEMAAVVAAEGLEVLRPELGQSPACTTGTSTSSRRPSSPPACLRRHGRMRGRRESDSDGRWRAGRRFRGEATASTTALLRGRANPAASTLTVQAPGYAPATSSGRLDASLNLGTIRLAKL